MCIHYRREVGIDRADCPAGINARNLVGGSDVGWIKRCPCFHSNNPEGGITCDQYEEPSLGELEAHEKEWEEYFSKVTPWLLDMKERYGAGSKGIDPDSCPICTADVHFYIASNNHLHAQCTTENCFSLHQ